MLAKLKLLAICCFALLFGAVLFFAVNSRQTHAAQGLCGLNGNNEGSWVNAYTIDCGTLGNHNWYYEPRYSAQYGGVCAIFVNQDASRPVMAVANDGVTFALVDRNTVNSKGNVNCGSNADQSGTLANGGASKQQSDPNTCSILHPTDCTPYGGGDYSGNKAKFTAADASANQTSSTNTNAATTAGNAQASDNAFQKECQDKNQAGALSFVLCPLVFSVSQSIDQIVSQGGILTNLLQVQPLAFPSLGGANQSSDINLQTQTNQIVALADVLYIFLFIVLLFANAVAVGIDNYTVKKTLPRLLAAVILTQFAYIICAIAIDLGNIAGVTLPNFIASIGGLNFSGSIHNFLSINGGGFAGFLSGLGAFFVVLIASIAILAVLIIAVVYMIFRNLFIYLLVIVSPLAFAAMVLPGTQKYFKMWGQNFIKLILMYPIITCLLALSGVISNALFKASQANGGSNNALALMAAIIPILALALIPKCLKWSGDLMEITAGAAASYLGARAGSAKGKAGDSTKALQEKRQQSIAMGSGKVLGDENTRRRRFLAGAGVRRNRPKNIVKFGATQSAAMKPYMDAAKYGSKDDVEKLLASKNSKARIAATIVAGQRGMGDELEGALRAKTVTKSDMNAVKNIDYDALKSVPDLRDWDFDTGGPGQGFYDKLTGDTVASMSAGSRERLFRNPESVAKIPSESLKVMFENKNLRAKVDDVSIGALKGALNSTGNQPYQYTNNDGKQLDFKSMERAITDLGATITGSQQAGLSTIASKLNSGSYK